MLRTLPTECAQRGQIMREQNIQNTFTQFCITRDCVDDKGGHGLSPSNVAAAALDGKICAYAFRYLLNDASSPPNFLHQLRANAEIASKLEAGGACCFIAPAAVILSAYLRYLVAKLCKVHFDHVSQSLQHGHVRVLMPPGLGEGGFDQQAHR
mmetsp:Transcript_59365/g.173639  ORF Transcript_59365/g.173639 Transcript_59365/m.173639 type:complete len:153 (-) Transcript_59365:211-669(-)